MDTRSRALKNVCCGKPGGGGGAGGRQGAGPYKYLDGNEARCTGDETDTYSREPRQRDQPASLRPHPAASAARRRGAAGAGAVLTDVQLWVAAGGS